MFDKVNVTTHLTIIKGDPKMLKDSHEGAQKTLGGPNKSPRQSPLLVITGHVQAYAESIDRITQQIEQVTTRLVGPFPAPDTPVNVEGQDCTGEYNILRYNIEYLGDMIQKLDEAVTLLEEQS